jgi:hypothetical protein
VRFVTERRIVGFGRNAEIEAGRNYYGTIAMRACAEGMLYMSKEMVVKRTWLEGKLCYMSRIVCGYIKC